MRTKWYFKIPLFVVLGAVLAVGLGYVFMALWNALIPVLFHGPVLTFWQAVGLFILAKILLHSIRFDGYSRFSSYSKYPEYWKKRLDEKMAAMTPEEREKFKEAWKKRCGHSFWHHPHAHEKDISAETE